MSSYYSIHCILPRPPRVTAFYFSFSGAWIATIITAQRFAADTHGFFLFAWLFSSFLFSPTLRFDLLLSIMIHVRFFILVFVSLARALWRGKMGYQVSCASGTFGDDRV